MNKLTTIKLAVKTLMEVVESPKNIEICVVTEGGKHELLDDETVEKFVREINKEKEEEEAAKKAK